MKKKSKNKSENKYENEIQLPIAPTTASADGKQHNFFEDVWDVARQIPKGRVTSFGAIAAYLGAKSSSRMVGWAMSGAHAQLGEPVPAHRVVNRSGLLSGRAHFSPPEKMQQLLENEGVEVADHQVRNFKEVFWDPSIELAL